jgi:hypothetical protein
LLKSKGQIVIILLGLISMGLAIKTMLATPTLFIRPWFLVLFYLPILLIISFVLGHITLALTKINANKFTNTSIFVTLISLAFYFSEYKPTKEIFVPGNFSGEVKLFLSKETKDDLHVNKFGIGYISNKTYYNGFKPYVRKDGQDITNLTDLGEGSIGCGDINGKNIGPYKYLTFTVPGQFKDSLKDNLMKLIELNALDTSRVLK